MLYVHYMLYFSCSLCLTRTGHPEIPQICPAASGAVLDKRVTHRPSCREIICYLSGPPPMQNGALGMCCNLVECQIALLDWALSEFSGDRPVRDETSTPKGANDIIRERDVLMLGIIFHNDSSLLSRIERVTRPQLPPVFQYAYCHLLLITFRQ